MKKLILKIMIAFTLVSCNKEEITVSPCEDQLPAITTTGANTFGCCINGNLLKPRDGSGTFGGSDSGFQAWSDTSGNNEYDEIDIHDFASERTGKILIHIQNFTQIGVGNYIIDQSNGLRGYDSNSNTHLFCKIFDYNDNQYKYYRSYDNSGILKVTKCDFVNKIYSGTFSCKVVNSSNNNDTIQVKDGRFDYNAFTIFNTSFP